MSDIDVLKAETPREIETLRAMSSIANGNAVKTKFKPTIREQFYAFHASNHEVADELALLAFDLQNKGHKRGGMKMLFEVLRWQRMMRTNDPFSEFKLNNNYTSHYARMLTRCYPRLDGFFELRQMRSP